jgi:hypothetical protein
VYLGKRQCEGGSGADNIKVNVEDLCLPDINYREFIA